MSHGQRLLSMSLFWYCVQSEFICFISLIEMTVIADVNLSMLVVIISSKMLSLSMPKQRHIKNQTIMQSKRVTITDGVNRYATIVDGSYDYFVWRRDHMLLGSITCLCLENVVSLQGTDGAASIIRRITTVATRLRKCGPYMLSMHLYST